MGDSKADHSPTIIRTRVVLKINTIDLNRVDTHSVCLSNGNANNGYTIDVVPYCLQQPIACSHTSLIVSLVETFPPQTCWPRFSFCSKA